MAHTPLAKLLRHAASTAARSDTRDATTDDSGMSRRKFVRTISVATAGLALPSSLFGATRVATTARVVVVGAGLAGLTCAYRLKEVALSLPFMKRTRAWVDVVGPDAGISRKDKMQNMAANSSIRGIQLFASSHRSSVCRWITCSQQNQTVRRSFSTSMALPIPIAMPFVI